MSAGRRTDWSVSARRLPYATQSMVIDVDARLIATVIVLHHRMAHHHSHIRNATARRSTCRMPLRRAATAQLVAEFNEVQARLEQVAEAREAGERPNREVSFLVSETSLIFMAWLDRLLRQRASGGLRIVAPSMSTWAARSTWKERCVF